MSPSLSPPYPAFHRPPPLALPLKYRRKSLSAPAFDPDSDDSRFPSALAFSPPASPVASARDPAHHPHIRLPSSPLHPGSESYDVSYRYGYPNDVQSHEHAHPNRKANEYVSTGAHSAYAYAYTPSGRSSFSYSSPSDSEDALLSSSSDFEPHMDIDVDASEYDYDNEYDDGDDAQFDYLSHPRRISFSTSAERDRPFIRTRQKPAPRLTTPPRLSPDLIPGHNAADTRLASPTEDEHLATDLLPCKRSRLFTYAPAVVSGPMFLPIRSPSTPPPAVSPPSPTLSALRIVSLSSCPLSALLNPAPPSPRLTSLDVSISADLGPEVGSQTPAAERQGEVPGVEQELDVDLDVISLANPIDTCDVAETSVACRAQTPPATSCEPSIAEEKDVLSSPLSPTPSSITDFRLDQDPQPSASVADVLSDCDMDTDADEEPLPPRSALRKMTKKGSSTSTAPRPRKRKSDEVQSRYTSPETETPVASTSTGVTQRSAEKGPKRRKAEKRGPVRKKARVVSSEPESEAEPGRDPECHRSARDRRRVSSVDRPRAKSDKARVDSESEGDAIVNVEGSSPAKPSFTTRHHPSVRPDDSPSYSPLPPAEMEGMLIEALATSRASSLAASALHASLMASRPALKAYTGPHGDAPLTKREWVRAIEDALEAGRAAGGVFGKVVNSGNDTADHPLEAQWFYVPERDADQERATLICSMMPRPGKRSETKKSKQYYWRPLPKISRWDPEDEM
ncbi:hypothetical protein A0H81_09467 [Grifola frondosa]|uniref:Uncharacterized protein n=1 Tax=Grifola frondosa TaxID=5627 RepID=A0A1C7M235_GRIFR|nr:hypothetical protein A0H81_09467 [Grifola frondosa]